ncbi:helix-turn-helix domain-containing protein [Chloroflexota bacterium]
MEEKLLNGGEVAQILGISRSKAYTLMRNGTIEVVKFGRNVRVTEKALARFIKESTVNPYGFDTETKLSAATESKANYTANATNSKGAFTYE